MLKKGKDRDRKTTEKQERDGGLNARDLGTRLSFVVPSTD